MTTRTSHHIIAISVGVVLFIVLMLLSLVGCATLNSQDNGTLDKEKERVEDINPEDLHPRP